MKKLKKLKATNLFKYYGKGDNLVKAVDDVSISMEENEFMTIVGSSGSGKTTLLHLLGGLDYPDKGEVLIEGRNLYQMKDEERTIFRRRKIGFIFQNYNLVPTLSVYKNIILPFKLDNKQPDEVFVKEVVGELGIESKMEMLPGNLSGGQQQRVAIARAIITNPAIILADEPTGNLDSKNSLQVIELLKKTSKDFKQSIIMITHNNEIAKHSDRIIEMEDGKVLGDI